MNTLPDAVREGLRAIAVGINPSLPSVRAGFYFANPRNRFWPALNASRLVDAPLEPGPDAVAVLVERYGIGFTDIVKRPTAGSGGASTPRVSGRRGAAGGARRPARAPCRVVPGRAGLAGLRPVHRDGVSSGEVAWGAQEWRIGDARIFVTPNPSPANAAFSLPVLVGWFDVLAEFLASGARRRVGRGVRLSLISWTPTACSSIG